jgi:hypothetical protein
MRVMEQRRKPAAMSITPPNHAACRTTVRAEAISFHGKTLVHGVIGLQSLCQRSKTQRDRIHHSDF